MEQNQVVFDGSFIKAQAERIANVTTQTGVTVSEIMRETVVTIHGLDVPQTSMLEIVGEGTKKFSKEERTSKATAYQYASRIRSIFGAYLFCDVVPSGNINEMTSAASKALKDAGINWKGESVAEKDAAKEQAEVSKLQAEERAKALANNPELAQVTVAELDELIAANVNARQAEQVILKAQEAAEKFAAKMLEGQGEEYAQAFAQALMAAVYGAEVTTVEVFGEVAESV